MHMLPQLRQLEAQFRDELVVIGVHAGKYPNERRTPHIQHAAQRFGVHHPVLNDRKYRMWRAYEIGAWPTLVLLDPHGNILGTRLGETTAADWTPLLTQLIAQGGARGVIDRTPRRWAPEHEGDPIRPLAHPEKVLAQNNHLFVADTGHHRVLVGHVRDDRLKVHTVIGSGQRGHADGSISAARFDQPRGLALHGSTLYIADTANHLIRAVDFDTNTVRTIAGTGERGTNRTAQGAERDVAIASPWDLVLHNGQLMIAMAGLHQVWQYDPRTDTIMPLAGTGYELLDDGPLIEAALAQPCGITSDGHALYTADAESQAIRRITLGADGQVSTLIGTGLFDYGDKDGSGDKVLLQHPQAVAAHGGQLYIADSYNHRIKILDPRTRTCHGWLGGRRIPGHADGIGLAASFFEPGGLSIAGNTLYIADTNNNAIRAADLATAAVRTLLIDGV